jgi:23S rRNA (guanosine2251-2'-O)-methyltransferase
MTDGSTHGGLVAVVGERKTVTLADLTQPANKHLTPFIVMLDGVEDPFNFGQAIRALYACGATGLIVRPRNWMSAAAIVARSSGGASELISMAVVEDPIEAMTTLRGLGLKIVVLDKTDDAIPLTQANLRDSIFVIIGGEKRGVSKAVLALADANIKIPYGRHFRQSLGTTSAAAILGYEVMRQRRVEGY